MSKASSSKHCVSSSRKYLTKFCDTYDVEMSASGEDDEHKGGQGQGSLLQGNQVNQGGGEQPGGDLLGQVRHQAAPGQGDDQQEAVSSGDSEQG